MASPNATFTEMVTTTLRNHKKMLVDNVSKNNALLSFLKKKGKIKTESGGYEIVLPLDYAENSTYQRYSGYDPLNVSASDVLSAAKYDWAQAAIHVTASGRELRMNNGPEAMIKLVKARVTNAMRTTANNMSTDLYSAGALTNQIGGLDLLVSDDGTGTVGGIVSGTYTWWKNQFTEVTNPTTYAGVKAALNSAWLSTTRGSDKTDLIVSTHDLYSAFESGLQDLQRYESAEAAELGFQSLRYKGAALIFDDNASHFTTTGETMYLLNTEYLYLIEHTDARWEQEDEKKPTNQDAIVIPIYWMGQLVCSNRARQGKIVDATST
jgi:hypothetical protein